MRSARRAPPHTVIDDDATGNVERSGSFDADEDGIDYWESLEGMLLQIDDAVVVGPTNQYGETWVIGDGGAGGDTIDGGTGNDYIFTGSISGGTLDGSVNGGVAIDVFFGAGPNFDPTDPDRRREGIAGQGHAL